MFARDAAASDLADELAGIDSALRQWPEPKRSEEGWNALAERIEQRLDETLPPAGDVTAPPRFEVNAQPAPGSADRGEHPEDRPATARAPQAEREEGGDARTSSGEFSLDVLTHREGSGAPRTPGEDRFSFSDIAVAPPRVGGGIPGYIDVSNADPEREEPRRRRGLWIGGGLAAAAAVGLAVVVGLSSYSGDEERVASAPAAESAAAASGEELAEEGWAEPGASPSPEPTAPAEAERALEPAEQPLEEPEEAAAAEEPARGDVAPGYQRSAPAARARPTRARRTASGSELRVERHPRAPAPREESSSGGSSGGGGSAGMTGGGGGSTAATGSAGGPEELPETPAREDVVRAMNAVRSAVSACAQDRHGTVSVDVTVGSSGRVRSAVVTGYFAGKPEGSCVARAVRRATLPRFTRDTFSFTYPFTL